METTMSSKKVSKVASPTATKKPARKPTPPAAQTDAEGNPLSRSGKPKRDALDSARARALKRLAQHNASKPAKGTTIGEDTEFDLPSPSTPPTPASVAKSNKASRNAPAAKESPTVERGAKGAKDAKAKPAKHSKPKVAKSKRLSALDAAAKVLAESDRPLRAIDMIEVMHAQGLWTSPGGKTPEATLYAAITREIAAKGTDARFQKVDRGMFASAANSTSGKGA
jgi:hypothetical protein